ncbi:MAG: RIP metalloprotease RseP [Treponemataceae bacterium]|nr:RIP metalloprotease RseP [Treponemataceae bacterium]
MVVVWGLLGLCVIVVVHEFGHFIAAKALGIDVEAFSVGMGPVLLHKNIKGTDFRLSLLPIGGYCAMHGEDAFQRALDEKLDEIPKEKGSFYEKPLNRLITAFAGPFTNLVFAVLAFTIIALVGRNYQTASNRIIIASEVYPEINSAAANAGIISGDKILQINSEKINNFTDLYTFVALHPDEDLQITVDRNGEILSFQVHSEMEKATASGKIGVTAWIDPVVAEVYEDSPAQKAGFLKGDIIVAVNGEKVEHSTAIQKIIDQIAQNSAETYTNSSEFMIFSVLRNGNLCNLNVPVELNEETKKLKFGVAFETISVEERTFNIFKAFASGIKETGEMIALTFKTITWFFKGIDIKQAVSGPIRITVMLGEAAENGFAASIRDGIVTVLNFLALISTSLFIMNLLPIPVLDGGLMLFAFIELVRGKGVKPRTLYIVQIIGWVVIGLLFAIGFSGDMHYIFERFAK